MIQTYSFHMDSPAILQTSQDSPVFPGFSQIFGTFQPAPQSAIGLLPPLPHLGLQQHQMRLGRLHIGHWGRPHHGSRASEWDGRMGWSHGNPIDVMLAAGFLGGKVTCINHLAWNPVLSKIQRFSRMFIQGSSPNDQAFYMVWSISILGL